MKSLAFVFLLAAKGLWAVDPTATPLALGILPPPVPDSVSVTASPTPKAAVPRVEMPETPTPTPVPQSAEAHGFTYSFSFAGWNVFNGAPLSYTLLEAGWAFENGVRIQEGLDLFYYTGKEYSSDLPGQVNFYYQMQDFRTSVLYRMPLKFRLRPLVGLTIEAVHGSRSPVPNLVGNTNLNNNVASGGSWGFLGTGALVGAEWLFNRDWSLQASGRYIETYSQISAPIVVQTSLCVIF